MEQSATIWLFAWNGGGREAMFISELLAAQDQRDDADRRSLAAAQRVVSGIKAEPEDGEDGVRRSERRSGPYRVTPAETKAGWGRTPRGRRLGI